MNGKGHKELYVYYTRSNRWFSWGYSSVTCQLEAHYVRTGQAGEKYQVQLRDGNTPENIANFKSNLLRVLFPNVEYAKFEFPTKQTLKKN